MTQQNDTKQRFYQGVPIQELPPGPAPAALTACFDLGRYSGKDQTLNESAAYCLRGIGREQSGRDLKDGAYRIMPRF